MVLYPFQSTGCLGVQSGIHEGNLKVLGVGIVYDYFIILQFYGHIGVMQEIIKKIFLNNIPLVAQANDKIVKPLGRKYFHDMPEDRLIPDLDHRFWSQMGFFRDPGSQAAGENYHLHFS
jgi:hypothetical protein